VSYAGCMHNPTKRPRPHFVVLFLLFAFANLAVALATEGPANLGGVPHIVGNVYFYPYYFSIRAIKEAQLLSGSVPEPATLTVIGIGLLGLSRLARREQNQSSEPRKE
jgi:hypothetical protein